MVVRYINKWAIMPAAARDIFRCFVVMFACALGSFLLTLLPPEGGRGDAGQV